MLVLYELRVIKPLQKATRGKGKALEGARGTQAAWQLFCQTISNLINSASACKPVSNPCSNLAIPNMYLWDV